MSTSSRQKWDKIYRSRGVNAPAVAAAVVQRYLHLVPANGRALDYACGRGGNAMAFAECGLESHAWDISAVAVDQLRQRCDKVRASVVDLSSGVPHSLSFDVIAVSYYLDRARFKDIIALLKPGGLLFYETFNRALDSTSGPSNPDFLLCQGELLRLCKDLDTVFFEEYWDCADSNGKSGVSRIVARRPSDN